MEGLVIKKSQGSCVVQIAGQALPCAISNRLRKTLIYPIAAPTSPKRRGRRVEAVKELDAVDPVAVGDIVCVTLAGDGTGLVTDVLPRRNQLLRPRNEQRDHHAWEQALVANIDQLIAVFAVHPDPRWHLLDRYLVMGEAAGIPTIICLTKMDLAEDAAEVEQAAEAYRRIGYPAVLTSAVAGAGLEEFKGRLRGQTSALMGKSGAGKTSLLNAVEPGLGLRVNAVNRHTGEGRHTTSHMEMFELAEGGRVVDTPGLRLFKLTGVDSDGLAGLLPDLRPYVGQCKFGLDCTHAHEPGCAVRAAVEAGRIAPRRYESYLDMQAYFGL
jgi:ribosome biogenesis GTPase